LLLLFLFRQLDGLLLAFDGIFPISGFGVGGPAILGAFFLIATWR